jgi:hypothetical protein
MLVHHMKHISLSFHCQQHKLSTPLEPMWARVIEYGLIAEYHYIAEMSTVVLALHRIHLLTSWAIIKLVEAQKTST